MKARFLMNLPPVPHTTDAGASFEDFEAALEAAGCQPKNGKALCPLHEEHSPSFTYKAGDVNPVVRHCFVCGPPKSEVEAHRDWYGEICYALENWTGHLPYPAAWEVKNSGGSSGGGNYKFVCSYDYQDADGEVLY